MPNWIEIRNSIEMTDNSLRINLDETDRHPQRIYIYIDVSLILERGEGIQFIGGKKGKGRKKNQLHEPNSRLKIVGLRNKRKNPNTVDGLLRTIFNK